MCTTIKLKNSQNIILAQNYDFYYGHGLVIMNKRGVIKNALVDDMKKEDIYSPDNSGAKWTSKYGSITFNQFGRELPTCGMNEAGLAVASMWHNTEQKPAGKGKNQITELQWIQMQLDLYSSIDEVVENLDKVSLGVKMYPMHYHLSDKRGKSVIVEIKDGKLKSFDSPDISGCSNAGLAESVEYMKKHQNISPTEIRIKEPIFDRAAIAIGMSRDFNQKNGSNIHKKAFEILDKVSLQVGFGDLFRWIGKGIPPSQTFWQILFDISEMKIYFKTKKDREERMINMSNFDFSTQTPVKVLDMEDKRSGDVTDLFQHYTIAENQRIIKKSFGPVKKEFPESEQDELAEYPELLKVMK